MIKVTDLILAKRRLSVCGVADKVDISVKRECHILKEIMAMRKLLARWVLQLLFPDKRKHCDTT